jgi:hypothetical protein
MSVLPLPQLILTAVWRIDGRNTLAASSAMIMQWQWGQVSTAATEKVSSNESLLQLPRSGEVPEVPEYMSRTA